MSYLMFVMPVVVPVLFWAGYHYYKDRHLPEPPGNLALCFLLGVGSFYLGRYLYVALDFVGLRHDAYALAETNPAGLLAYAVLVIGMVEELAKLAPFLIVALRFRAFDEPIDGIIYASFIALGFAAVENIEYLQYLTNTEAIGRGFAGPLVHIMFASIWAYRIGRAHLRRESVLRAAVVGLAIAATLHGLYDFVVIALPPPALPLSALLILVIWVWRMSLIRDLHAAQRAGE